MKRDLKDNFIGELFNHIVHSMKYAGENQPEIADHGPPCVAFHCSHPIVYITPPGPMSHFAKKMASLQIARPTYKSKY